MRDPKPSLPPNNPMQPRVYTGDGKPDMAVDYIPGDDPASLDNDPTTDIANTTPPPLREE
jgi:hypothetical protein